MTRAGGEPGAVRALRSDLRRAWTNANVRRVQLAFMGSKITDWSYAMAVLVWAYQEGGSTLVGLWAGARLLLASFAGPIGGAVADRMSRQSFMMANNAIRFVLVLVTAAAIHVDIGVWAVLVPGTLLIMVGASFRPAQGGLLPSLVDTPKELTSANATAEMVDSTAVFVGPALAGLLLSVFGLVPVVLFNAFGFLWSMLLLAGVRVGRGAPAPLLPSDAASRTSRHATSPTPGVAEQKGESVWGEVTGGFRAIFGDRDLIALSVLLSVNGVLAGVLSVLVITVAAEMIGDPAAAGWLNAVLGIATIVGGVVMLAVAGRARLGRLMVIGVLGWCVPLVALGLVPEFTVIIVVFLLIGLSDPMINVGFGTIPPRLVPDRLLTRVFAAMESQSKAAGALGALLTPVLVSVIGLQQAVVALGAGGGVVTLLCALRIPHLDGRLVPPRGLELLLEVTLFSPLTPSMLEQIAHRLESVTAGAGDVLIAEGGVSDLFYIIESGQVEVTSKGRVLRTESVGDVFGEIGLLRDVPRTATVTATTDTRLLTLSREDFLALLAGERRIRGLAHELATRRLAM